MDLSSLLHCVNVEVFILGKFPPRKTINTLKYKLNLSVGRFDVSISVHFKGQRRLSQTWAWKLRTC